MAQYIYTMNGVGKVVPPNRFILKDIYLNFFPGAKIGVLGYNGAGKSTLLRICRGRAHRFRTREVDAHLQVAPDKGRLSSLRDGCRGDTRFSLCI